MSILVAIYVFIIGASMGSFVGAMAWRYYHRRGVVKERSECEYCHHVLSPLDLVPVVSWLYLRGRCRYCHKQIGATTLFIELGLGLAFLVSYLCWPFGFMSYALILFILWLIGLVGLTFLLIYDARHYLLPDVVVLPLIALGIGMFVLRMLIEGTSTAHWVVGAILGLLPVSGVYGLLYLYSKGEWVGFGDVKLGIFMGLVLGWQGALLALVMSNFIGLLFVLPGMVQGKSSRKTQVPFGPFLIIATFIVFLFGHGIINWYLSLASI
jgi:prepilin signal peptidase PulO-like enzyme (type II secretory pathway)